MNLAEGLRRGNYVRLLINVEGQTEETFVNEVLAPHLRKPNGAFDSVNARLYGDPRQNKQKWGGGKTWSSVANGILYYLKSDSDLVVTTMVDYYGMPNDWPGRREAPKQILENRATFVENAIFNDIHTRLGTELFPERFFPYVSMHEFESLLFSDCEKLGSLILKPKLVKKFAEVRKQFKTPEEINDSPETAPSKRIKKLDPSYNKELFGNIVALGIGLSKMRDECPHFASWLQKLESIKLEP